jgi:hypothetical protein
MKNLAIAVVAALAAMPVCAQTANSGSDSAANAGAIANIAPVNNGSSSANSNASSGSLAGAIGNTTNVIQDFSAPKEQTVNQNVKSSQSIDQKISGTQTLNQNTNVSGTTTQNINQTISGGTTTRVENVNSGSTQHTLNQNYSGEYTVKSAPNMVAPNIGVSAPCKVAITGSVSVVGLGVAAGGSLNDEECQLREDVRVLAQMNEQAGALALMCSKPAVYKAMPKKCDAAMAATGATPPEEPKKKAEAPAQQQVSAPIREASPVAVAPVAIVTPVPAPQPVQVTALR